MRAEIWFYEGDDEEDDPILIHKLWSIPQAVRTHPTEWECGHTVLEDCSIATLWRDIKEHLGVVLKKLGE